MELLGIHGKETLFKKHGPNLSQTICSHNPVEMEIIRKTKTKKSPEAEYRSNQMHLVFGNFFAHFLQVTFSKNQPHVALNQEPIPSHEITGSVCLDN